MFWEHNKPFVAVNFECHKVVMLLKFGHMQNVERRTFTQFFCKILVAANALKNFILFLYTFIVFYKLVYSCCIARRVNLRRFPSKSV